MSPEKQADKEYEKYRDEISKSNEIEQVGYVDEDYFEDQEAPDEKFSLGTLSPDNLVDNIKKSYRSTTGRGRSPAEARELKKQADALWDKAIAAEKSAQANIFVQASKIYSEAAVRWEDSALEQDCLFKSGECLFQADRYPDANLKYEAVIAKYPNTKHLDVIESRRFMVAQYWLKVDDASPTPFYALNLTDKALPLRGPFSYAIKIYDKIRLDDPTGKLADDATMAAGVACLERGDFYRADSYFIDLRTAFPRSEHQFMAHYLGIKAKLASYEGPKYSSDAIDGAADLLSRIKRQFPRDYQSRREEFDEMDAKLKFLLAEREWTMAQYYANRSEYGGARYYYSIILRNYPGTSFAEKAKEKMAAYQDEPDNPPTRFGWLIDAMPKSAEERIANVEPDGESIRR